MTWILGVYAGHNASACIGNREGLKFAVQEERYRREKNYWGFPDQAIQACLDHLDLSPSDIELIVGGGYQNFCRYHSREDVLTAYRRQKTLVGQLRQRLAMPLILAVKKDYGQDHMKAALVEMGFGETPVKYFDHHRTHAATAFYGLRADPSQKVLVATCDGSGDNLCASLRIMQGDGEEVVSTSTWDHSLGALYSWVTFISGFVPLEHEYKLMGMAPYAKVEDAQRVAAIFEKYLGLSADGLSLERKVWQRTNDIGDSLRKDFRDLRFDHIAAGLQLFTENLLATWIQNGVRATGVTDVVAAGGVFMNVKANKTIAEIPEVTSFEAYPSCGDETRPIGAFYLEQAERWGHESVQPLEGFYLGDSPAEEEIEAALRSSEFAFEKHGDIAVQVAEVLASGQPIARCAGPMEFGARALGNRSILADPQNGDVVRVINQMIKKRDFWMPFAPMVLEERASDYLVNPKGLKSPFMMMTFDSVPATYNDIIAAVHQADLTCRPQILSRNHNEPLHDILRAFEAKTGRGTILNTSFNLHGFPIVRTAEDALQVMRHSGLKFLQLGDYLVEKRA